jgi:integrase
MPWAERLPNGLWRGFWRDDLGHRRSKSGIKTKAAALRFAGEQEAKSRRGEATYAGSSPTWGTWRDVWLASRTVEPATAKQDRVRINRHLTPQWADVRLNRITRAMVQTWVIDLAQTDVHRPTPKKRPEGWTPPDPRPLAPSTVDRIYRLFSASMKAAVLDGQLAASPCVGINVPTAAPGHERYLTWGEFLAVARFLREPWLTAAVLLVGTGMRFGEAAGLHWQRVDMATGLIDVVETWDPAARRIKAYPKGKLRRSVPIPSWLRPYIEAQLDRQGDSTTCGLTHARGARCRSGLVIPAPEGGAMDGKNFGQRDWADAVTLARIGHVRLHDLRHTYASWLRQAGVDLEEVQRLLGHASITTTQRYSHLGASQHSRVVAALEGLEVPSSQA